MYRFFALLIVCWTMGVDTQLLTSVSSGIGDDSITFNCGLSFGQANATGFIQVTPGVPQFDTSSGKANPVSVGTTVLEGSGSQSNAIQWSIWYATGGANYSNDYALGYDICAFTFPTYSTNTLWRGQSDTGNCFATFDEECVSALESAAAGYANDLISNATPNPNSNLTASHLGRVCYDIGQSLENNFPSECQKYMNNSLALTTGGFPLTGNGSSPLYNGCDLMSSDNNTYHLLSTVNAVVPSSLQDAYYAAFNWQILPAMLTFMPVVNIDAGLTIGSSSSRMACLRANKVSPGSDKPPAAPTPTPLGSGGLSGGAIAGIVVGVVVGVALIAGAAFWFWRRRRAQTKQTSAEASTAEHPPAYGDTKEHQTPIAEAPADTGIKELSPDTELRSELAGNYKPELKRGNTGDPAELPADVDGPNSTR